MIPAVPASPIRPVLPLLAALALAACGSEPAEPATYEADAIDEGGGELIVTEQTPAVEVELPETPMTPVPPGATATPSPAPEVTTPVETPAG